MKLSYEALKNLIKSSVTAKPVEIGCDDCLDHIDMYAELHLAGKAIPESLKLVQEHLSTCPPCREEFEALLRALTKLNLKNH